MSDNVNPPKQKKKLNKDDDFENDDSYEPSLQKKVKLDTSASKKPKANEKSKKDEKKKKEIDEPEMEVLRDEIRFTVHPKKKVVVSKFKGQVLVSIREYYEKDGELLPTQKGCSLTLDAWEKLKGFVNHIDQAVKETE